MSPRAIEITNRQVVIFFFKTLILPYSRVVNDVFPTNVSGQISSICLPIYDIGSRSFHTHPIRIFIVRTSSRGHYTHTSDFQHMSSSLLLFRLYFTVFERFAFCSCTEQSRYNCFLSVFRLG